MLLGTKLCHTSASLWVSLTLLPVVDCGGSILTPEIATCLGILVVAVFLFAWDQISAEVVALGVMLAILVTGLLPAERAFQGFGSDTVIMILGLLIMSAGLIQTGVVDMAGKRMFEFAEQVRQSSCPP